MILLTNITVKCQLVFVLTQENVSSKRFNFKTSRKTSLNNGTRYFQNDPPFIRSTHFHVKTTRDFEYFQYFKFETLQFFKTFFEKLEYFLFVEIRAHYFITKLSYQKLMLR